MSERIKAPAEDWWVCVCGNEPHTGGFYPYHEGREVEPIAGGPWDGVHYVCADCCRVINQETLEVVARPLSVTFLDSGVV